MFAAEKLFRERYFEDSVEYLSFSLAHKIVIKRGKFAIGPPGALSFKQVWGSSLQVRNLNDELEVFDDRPNLFIGFRGGWYACWLTKGSSFGFPHLPDYRFHRPVSCGPAFHCLVPSKTGSSELKLDIVDGARPDPNGGIEIIEHPKTKK